MDAYSFPDYVLQAGQGDGETLSLFTDDEGQSDTISKMGARCRHRDAVAMQDKELSPAAELESGLASPGEGGRAARRGCDDHLSP